MTLRTFGNLFGFSNEKVLESERHLAMSIIFILSIFFKRNLKTATKMANNTLCYLPWPETINIFIWATYLIIKSRNFFLLGVEELNDSIVNDNRTCHTT